MNIFEINQENNKKLLVTFTGEFYQPGRIYFKVFNKKSLLNIFQKLRCILFNPKNNEWIWLYDYEAQKLQFEKSYYQIPKEHRPIIIGYFRFRGDDLMILDVRSLTRLLYAVEFFGKRINPHIAKATHLRLVNKLFSETENNQHLNQSFDLLFDQEISQPNHKEINNTIYNIFQEYPDEEEQIQALSNYIDTISNDILPEIEELLIDYYTDGIDQLNFCLQTRQIYALEHWKGNTEFSYANLITEIMNKTLDDDELE